MGADVMKMNWNNRIWHYFFGLLPLLSLAFASAGSHACAIDSEWDPQGGASTTGQPRYVNECAFHATAAGQYLEHTMNVTIDSSNSYIVSFYAFTRFNGGSGSSNSVTIFQALNSGGSDQFTLVITGDGIAHLTGTGISEITGAINSTSPQGYPFDGWNQYKMLLDDSGIELLINGNSAGTSSTSITTLDRQRIGHITSSSPNLVANPPLAFDEFVSLTQDSSATDLKCAGNTDPSSDDARDFDDVLAIYNEFASFGTSLTGGQPDYNGDGIVNFDDVLDVYTLFANFQGACN